MTTKRCLKQRAFSLIEALMAVAILAIAFLFAVSGMIVATQAQNKAANHVRVIQAGNYLLEQMRRDSFFWSTAPQNPAEWRGTTCTTVSPACWTGMSSSNVDDCNAVYPSYDDTYNTNYASWHTACINGVTQNTANPVTIKFLWRADPHGAWSGSPDVNMADLTIWVYANEDGRQEYYKVTGLNRFR
jgi:prepilin-type N-terminal cleavage/methylation domain-containing protein